MIVSHGVLFLYVSVSVKMISLYFFFNDTATTEIYTLSLHDALPISCVHSRGRLAGSVPCRLRSKESAQPRRGPKWPEDRKSTRLNSSHQIISYAVFCLKKKKKHVNKSTITYAPHVLIHLTSST